MVFDDCNGVWKSGSDKDRQTINGREPRLITPRGTIQTTAGAVQGDSHVVGDVFVARSITFSIVSFSSVRTQAVSSIAAENADPL
jgi:hypothetical protein